MNKEQFSQKLAHFDDNARIWIYQAERLLSKEEVQQIETDLEPFVAQWAHHGKQLKASSAVLYNLFIVLVVDESVAEVGGCGIDSSVHLVQKIGKNLQVDFFNRLAIAFFNGEKIECVNKNCFSELVNTDPNWSNDTLVFNNQIKTLADLKNQWIIPFKDSWHKNFFSQKDSFDLSL